MDWIPGSERSSGEGIGYPLQYFLASPMAQLVKNPPAMWENWVRSLSWEDPLEKGKATHSSILAWRMAFIVHGVSKSGTEVSNFHFHFTFTSLSLQVALVVKNLPANAGDGRDPGSISGPGRSPGAGHGNPLQYSCLEIPKDRGARWSTVHGVAKSQTRLK